MSNKPKVIWELEKALGAKVRSFGLTQTGEIAYLDLSVNEISDISPLAGLSNLSTLSLSINQIIDIDPLASLRNNADIWGNFVINGYHQKPSFKDLKTFQKVVKSQSLKHQIHAEKQR
jgi:hypothetical protein